MARALYFGFLDGGHYLHSDAGDRRSLNPKRDYPGFPWAIRLLDAGLLENGKVSDNVTGRVRWTCGGATALWFAFYWWDRSGDSRPNSNSGFYVRGFGLHCAAPAFEFACKAWPAVVERQAITLELVE